MGLLSLGMATEIQILNLAHSFELHTNLSYTAQHTSMAGAGLYWNHVPSDSLHQVKTGSAPVPWLSFQLT